jgi:hypothetical protein
MKRRCNTIVDLKPEIKGELLQQNLRKTKLKEIIESDR